MLSLGAVDDIVCEIVEFFGRTMRKGIQRAFTELGTRNAHDRQDR